MGQVPHIPVHGVRVFLGSFFFFGLLFIVLVDRHAMFFSVLHFIFSGLHVPDSPGSDDLHMRSECFDGQFETNLVIALAGSAVADSVSAVFLGHVDEAFADERTSEGGAQEVLAFIDAVSFQYVVSVFFDEFFSYVEGFSDGCTGFQRFFMDGIEVFRLPEVYGAGNNFTAIIFFQPRNDNGCIQSAGISKNYFFNAIDICHNDDRLSK